MGPRSVRSKKKRRKFKKRLPRTAEAVILGEMQKVERWLQVNWLHITASSIRSQEALEEVFDELRMSSDFLRDGKLGEGRRVDYLIADVVEMAEEIMDLSNSDMISSFSDGIKSTRDWLQGIRMCIINLRADGESLEDIRTENGGEGDEEDVVGLEEDVKQLLRRGIFDEWRPRLTTSVVKGMAGVGKTALARKVYNHEAVVDGFERRAWISLSSGLTHKEVYMKLIQQVVGGDELQRNSLLEKMEHTDNRSLQEMLRQHLQGMPYFIVVDNLPKGKRFLKCLLECLPNEDNGSRLLLTSRSQNNIIELVDYIHEMKTLDSDKSWQLFLKTISRFTSDEEQYKIPKHLEKKGREMLAKSCGGLPVAVTEMGRQKAKQRLEKGIEWEELLQLDLMDLSASMELLESSYRSLDKELQECFLQQCFFKENTTIRTDKLDHFLFARGVGIIISRPPIYELAGESLVEAVVTSRVEDIKRYRVNPLLHRLSIKIAEEEMGFEILRNFDGNSNGASSQTSPPRHRVIHCSRDNKFNHYYSMVNQDKHLVSLIFHGGGSYLDDAYWKRVEQLDILDLEDFGLKILSETLGTTLTELKYLGLRNNYIQEIPVSLGCLKKLEVLDIDQNFMVEVPDIIRKMGGLRHLYMSNVICKKPLKIDSLENLETLTDISIGDWAYEVSSLEKMIDLHKLGIEEIDENSNVNKLFASLAKLRSLRHLRLRGFRFTSMPCLDELRVIHNLRSLVLDGLLAKLPRGDFAPLNELKLVNTCLDEDPMPVLEKLTGLSVLKLWNAYTGREMVIRGFHLLGILHIKELWNLSTVQFGEGAMPLLKHLEIDSCPYLETLPKEIASRGMKLKMVTTKSIATKIRKSLLNSKFLDVDISP